MDTRTPLPKRISPIINSPTPASHFKRGHKRRLTMDIYVRAMEMKWRHIILIFGLSFISFNIVFATLYWIQDGSLVDASLNGPVRSFLDDFFFSVQTVATIGYGVLAPKTLYANVLVTIEIMAGVLGLAMVTGLMFARFSRPTARVMFSNIAVVAPFDGVPTLMFRAANQRQNLILEARTSVALTRMETTKEGRRMRRFRDLKLARSENLTFILSWTVMHPIDETSPLYGLSAEQLARDDIEIIVVMTGTDESFSQQVYARHSYVASDIVWDRQFADIIIYGEDGTRSIDYTRFHQLDETA